MVPLWAVTTLLALLGFTFATQTDMPPVQVSHYTASAERVSHGPSLAGTHTGEQGGQAGPSLHVSGPATGPFTTAPLAAPTTRSVLSPQSSALNVVRPPTMDGAMIRSVLQQYNSPAVDEAQAMYDLGLQYGIDPAICLAFFIVESAAGTRGMATETRSMGNIRATPGYVNHKGYRKYASWREGIEDWYRLIARLYVGEWGLTTVEAIVPVYAPAADNNEPTAYINSVRHLVGQWRAIK